MTKKSDTHKDQKPKSELFRERPEDLYRYQLEEEFDERIKFEIAMTQKYEEEHNLK